MKHSWMQFTSKRLAPRCALLAALFLSPTARAQIKEPTSRPVVVSARMERGTLIYRVNGKRVEDSVKNSLLTNLGSIVETRGTEVPVFIIIDVRAPFSEVGKLETALDMVGLTRYRLFVSDFRGGIMNEIHWDDKAIPIPRS